MRKCGVVLISLLLVMSCGCEVSRRVYLAVTKKIIRNVTVAMLPTIKAGQYVVIDREYYSSHPIQRFDLVIVKDPQGNKNQNGTDAFFLKRVIGKGGEVIEIRGGKLYLNGEILKEPFPIIPYDASEKFEPFTIPNGEYFLLGDNRPNSYDSRFWDRHSVDRSSIQAKATEVLPE